VVTLLKLEQAGFGYGSKMVVSGVDLTVDAGDFLGIVGPNGAGKTTLFRGLLGLLQPQCGRIERAPGAIGYVPQRENLDPIYPVSVAEVVHMGAYGRLRGLRGFPRVDRERAAQLLVRVGLADKGSAAFASLSGGQRQRVLIARALVQEAQLVLIDEPTSALDPEHQIRVFELLELSRSRGNSVVVATHDLNLAGQFATRLVLMQSGKIVADGRPREVLAPQVLTPVYGPHLCFGERALGSGGTRPFVMPWRSG
jgi:ABC-type Mn2+/Zn2+ transport system ATPase subunit